LLARNQQLNRLLARFRHCNGAAERKKISRECGNVATVATLPPERCTEGASAIAILKLMQGEDLQKVVATARMALQGGLCV
jgi:hypothetical protein